METTDNPQFHGGIVNYFQGATIKNLVINNNPPQRSKHNGERRSNTPPATSNLQPSRLAQGIQQVQSYMWGKSAYAVLFCVCRDDYHYANNMSQFEREIISMSNEQLLKVTCSEGTLAEAFRNNGYLKLPVSRWQERGVKQRVLELVDCFRKAMKTH